MGVEDIFNRLEAGGAERPARLPALENKCIQANRWDQNNMSTVFVQCANGKEHPLTLGFTYKNDFMQGPQLKTAALYLGDKPLALAVSQDGTLAVDLYNKNGETRPFGKIDAQQQQVTLTPRELQSGVVSQARYDYNETSLMHTELNKRFDMKVEKPSDLTFGVDRREKGSEPVSLNVKNADVLPGRGDRRYFEKNIRVWEDPRKPTTHEKNTNEMGKLLEVTKIKNDVVKKGLRHPETGLSGPGLNMGMGMEM